MDCYIWGAGGHARVVCSIIDTSEKELNVIGFVDYVKEENEEIFGRPILDPETMSDKETGNAAIVGVGDNKKRQEKLEELKKSGFIPVNAIHKDALVSNTSQVGNGVVIASGAIISTLAKIGVNSIINTGAIIDHETIVGDHCHVAPGVNVAGKVTIGQGSFIGIGSSIIDGITIGDNVTIGAGTVITENVPSNTVVVGVPGRVLRYKDRE